MIDCPLADLISAVVLEGFIRGILARVASTTAASYVRDVGEAMRVMEPDAARGLVQAAAADLERAARPSPDEWTPLVGASRIYEAALAIMDRTRDQSLILRPIGLEYLDGLKLVIEVLTEVRLRTLALTDRKHFRRVGDYYEITYEPHEVKTKKRDETTLPPELTDYIEHGFKVARWLAEKADAGETPMWPTRAGNRMSHRQTHARLCAATRQEVGVPLNPQRLRRIGATSLARFAPRHLHLAASSLQHHNARVTFDHYVKCGGEAAAVEFHRLLTSKFSKV